MLSAVNVNRYQNINYKGTNMKTAMNLTYGIDGLRDLMLQCEKSVTGYISPEVRIAINNRVDTIKTKAKDISPQKKEQLAMQLKKLIDERNSDITQTYLAIGDFEKMLSGN